jgi:hypothetical protein
MRAPTPPSTRVTDCRGGQRGRPPSTRHRLAVVAAGLVAAVTLTTVTMTTTPLSASAGAPGAIDPARDPTVISRWNRVAMDVLTPSGRPLLTQPFVVAAMHVAMYDAVVAIEGRYRPFGVTLTAPAGASPAAAAAVAAHDVLVGFLPASAAVFDAALAETLATIPDGPAETDGAAVGRAAAQGTLADRLGDGSQSGPVPPLREPGPGVWLPSPPATSGLTPWLAGATPFTMRSPDQFRPMPPPPLDSARSHRAVDEVRRLGSATSTERTAEQTTIARFWADQPIAQNQRALRGHAAALGWDIAPTARLFAASLTSQADAIIACWDAKYHYQLWRPWQSVPVVEPGWTPLLATPNHPEFPSAHGCVTGSLGYTLARVMGTDAIDLDIDAANIGMTRHYATRQDLLAEVGEARIWGGLHYRFSVDAGLRLAHRVVNQNLSHNFRPVE